MIQYLLSGHENTFKYKHMKIRSITRAPSQSLHHGIGLEKIGHFTKELETR